jgi:hypothetical protein
MAPAVRSDGTQLGGRLAKEWWWCQSGRVVSSTDSSDVLLLVVVAVAVGATPNKNRMAAADEQSGPSARHRAAQWNL